MVRFKPNLPFRLFCPMVNVRLSVFWWILGAKRSLWLTPIVWENQSPKNMNPLRSLQAHNETPLPGGGGGQQMEVKIQFTGVVDGSVSLPRIAHYGVSPYLVPNVPWDMILGHRWGYEHCESHFARFKFLFHHHPVHPCFWI